MKNNMFVHFGGICVLEFVRNKRRGIMAFFFFVNIQCITGLKN